MFIFAIFGLFSTILTNLERFNQNGVFTGERRHDGPSIYAIRKKVTEQFLRKLATIANKGFSTLFLTYFRPILTNLERFNRIGVFTREGGHDGSYICAITKKVTEQFLRKLALSAK